MKLQGVRAVRNNNPGNIERKDPWQGLMPVKDMTDEQRAEKRFCVFKSPKWGFRAMATLLITYYDKRKAKDGSRTDTIKEVIEHWAPPSENDTASYIRAVDISHPRTATERLDLQDYDDIAPLMKAIAVHECGGWFFKQRDLDEGLKLSGILPATPVSTTLVAIKDRGVQAGSVATASTVATGFMEVVGEAQGQFSDLALYLDVAKYALLGLALLSFGFFMWSKYRDLKQ